MQMLYVKQKFALSKFLSSFLVKCGFFGILAGIFIAIFVCLPNRALAADTGFLTAGANAAVSSSAGDNNGFETTPTNTAADDTAYAVSSNTGTGNATDGCTTFNQSEDDAHDFYNFGISPGSGSAINGIEITTNAKWSTGTGTNRLCIAVSWDAGSSWTTAVDSGDIGTTDVSDTYGGSTDTWGRTWTDTELNNTNFRMRIMIDPSGSNSTAASLDYLAIKVYYTPVITISGTCDGYDQTTDCGDTGEIKVAVNGTLNTTNTQTTVAGTWSITNFPQPASGASVVVFVDGVASSADKAVAITKYDGGGDVDNIKLFKEHVTIGTDGGANSDQTIALTNMDDYDYDNDTDILYDVQSSETCEGTSSFTGLCVDGGDISSQHELYIVSGDTFAPTGNLKTHDIEIVGTFTGNGNTYTITGSWLDTGTFTPSTSTVTFTATNAGETITTTGSTFTSLTFNGSGGGWTLQDSTTISGTLNIAAGTFNAGTGTTLTLSGSDSDAWCNDTSGVTCTTSWLSRKKITFDNSASTENFTDFPVLIQLSSSNIDYSLIKNNGEDIRFVDPSDNTVALDHEIELWNESGTSYVWVQVPTLNNTNSDYIWIYYNNSSASDGQNTTGVWDSNFKGVWHLAEAPDNTTAQIKDDTSNANNGTSVSMESGDQVDAKAGKGFDFDGTAERVLVPNSTSLNPQNHTISVWVKHDATIANGDRLMVFDKQWSGSSDSYMMMLQGNGVNTATGIYCIEVDAEADCLDTSSFVSDTWYHYVVSWDGSTMRMYKNGVVEATTVAHTATTTYNSVDLQIGAEHQTTCCSAFWDGIIDELRISGTARSAEWIEAEYLFTKDSVKYTYGSEESASSPFIISAGTFSAGTSTVEFTGSSATTITAATYNHLSIKPGANSITHTLPSGTITVQGNLIIGNGSNTGVTVQADTNDPNLDIDGNVTVSSSTTLQASASASMTVGGNWTTSGTFTHNNGSITFDSTGTAKTINGGTSNFYNVIFNGSGSEWSPLTNTLTVANDLTMTAGTLNNDDGSSNITVNGDVKCVTTCGSITLTAGTFTQSVAGDKNFGTSVSGSTAWSFNNLTFTATSDIITTSTTGTGNITVAGTLTISASTTLDAGNRTWILSANGTPFSVSGTFTPNISTFQYTHGTSATLTATTFKNLTIGGSGTYTMPGSTINITGNFSITSSATVTKGAGTVVFKAGGTQTWTDNTASKQDMGAVQISVNGGNTTLNLGSSVKTTSITVDASQILGLNGSNTLTLLGTGSPFSLNASATFTPSTGTIAYTPATSSTVTITSTVYHHIILNSTSTTFNLTTGGITTDNGGDLTITNGTLDTVSGQNYQVTVGGSWSNAGTFQARSGMVNFTSTSGGRTINQGSSNFNNITFNGSGGIWSPLTNTLTLGGDLTMTAGTLNNSNGSAGVTINGGDVTGNGTITLTNGTFTVEGASGTGFGGDTAWTFNNLTFGGDGNTETTSTTGTGGITISGTLTIGASQTLSAGNKTWTLSSGGTPITRSGTFTAGTSTITYTSASGNTALASAAMTGSNAFYNLTINQSGQTFTSGIAIETKNDLTVTAGNLSMEGNNLIVGNTSNTNSGNIKVASSQSISQSSSATTTILSSASGSNCIGSNGASCAGTAGTITFGGLILGDDSTAFTVTIGGTSPTVTVAGDLLINNNTTLNVGSATLVLTNNGTTVFIKDTTATFTPATSTISFASAATTGTTIPRLTYNNLTINKADNTFTAEGGGILSVAGNLNIAAGTLNLDTNDPVIDIDGNITITGTLIASATASLIIGGNWSKSGTFTHSNGTVTFDTANTAVISGTTEFSNINSIIVTKTLQFEAGTTFTIAGTFNIQGASGNPINIQSTSAGSQWIATFSNNQNSVAWVNIKDSGCSGGQTINANENIFNQGNNGSCWQFIVRGGGGVVSDGGGSGSSGSESGGGAGAGGGSESGSGGSGGQGGGEQGGGGGSP